MPSNPPSPPSPKRQTLAELRELQQRMAQALFRPLTSGERMQSRWVDGRPMREVAAEFIKPNDRLSSFERLEIYNRGYWFRVLDCLYDDYPALRAVIGQRKFDRLITAYLAANPSSSFTLRNLGSRMEQFIHDNPEWTAPRTELALDCARFEWAQVIAFDSEGRPPIGVDDLLGSDPSTLQLHLQPYLSFLALGYPLDDFSIALKKRDADILRSEASNAVTSAPRIASRRTVKIPKPERVFIAVHRHDNSLYYKRLEAPAFHILTALREGCTLADACERAALADGGDTLATSLSKWFHNWASLGWFCR